MKPTRNHLTFLVVLLSASLHSFAQTDLSYSTTLQKQIQLTASGLSSPTGYRVDASANAYGNLAGPGYTLSSVSFSPTGGGAWTGSGSNSWNYSESGLANLNSYPTGSYSWSFSDTGATSPGSPISLSLNTPSAFLPTPTSLTTSQSNWTTGTGPTWILVNPTLAFTINWNLPVGFNSSTDSISLNITSSAGGSPVFQQTSSSVSFLSGTVNANTFLTSGDGKYNVNLSFITSAGTGSQSFGTNGTGNTVYAVGTGKLETAISFQLQAVSAIPEPSTYAVFAGLGVLGFAACRRQRRRAA